MAKTKRLRIAKTINEAKSEDMKSETIASISDNLKNIEDSEIRPLIEDNVEINDSPPNLTDKTLAELAELALPYSNRSIETLKRLKREELLYIVTNQKDDYKKSELGTLGSDTKDLIELTIEICNEIKIKRNGKPINAILLKVFRNQDKKISEGLVRVGASGGIIGYSLCFFTLICVFIDAFFGFDTLFKLSKKANKENINKSDEKKQDNNYHFA